jgi:hypothetical protein
MDALKLIESLLVRGGLTIQGAGADCQKPLSFNFLTRGDLARVVV